jgi:hypothetical protein
MATTDFTNIALAGLSLLLAIIAFFMRQFFLEQKETTRAVVKLDKDNHARIMLLESDVKELKEKVKLLENELKYLKSHG